LLLGLLFWCWIWCGLPWRTSLLALIRMFDDFVGGFYSSSNGSLMMIDLL
jgi:hypothetical protein